LGDDIVLWWVGLPMLWATQWPGVDIYSSGPQGSKELLALIGEFVASR